MHFFFLSVLYLWALNKNIRIIKGIRLAGNYFIFVYGKLSVIYKHFIFTIYARMTVAFMSVTCTYDQEQ